MTSTTYSTSKSDSSSYEDGYNIFLRRSDFREKVLAKYDELVSSSIKRQSTLSVLDIGCGNGSMTARYLVKLNKACESIKLFLSETATESLKEALTSLKEYKPIPYEEVKNSDLKFNHIIASYVFYHLDPEVMNNLVEKLDRTGSLAIMMGTSDHPLKSHPALKKLSSHGSSDRLTPFLKRLGSQNEHFISRHKIDTFLDLNNLWKEESFNEEAKTLLSFSLNKNFDELPNEATDALNEIFSESFKFFAGKIKSVHEIIWIERKT
jgi:SAM-dependent methyltransferase